MTVTQRLPVLLSQRMMMKGMKKITQNALC